MLFSHQKKKKNEFLPSTCSVFFLIEIWLIPNAALVSGIQKDDSVMCIYMYVRKYIFFSRFFSLVDHYRILRYLCCVLGSH